MGPGRAQADIARTQLEVGLRRARNALFDLALSVEELTAAATRCTSAPGDQGLQLAATAFADWQIATAETIAAIRAAEDLRKRFDNLLRDRSAHP